MSFFLSLNQISKITDAYLSNIDTDLLEQFVKGINTDTRSLIAGELFIALKGDNFDGHNFIEQALRKEAIAIMVDINYNYNIKEKKIPLLKVKNTLEAYQKIANYWRNQLTIPIIAITGSVGKTTTKELISSVLEIQGKVLKTEANFNNEIGVPKTLLQIEKTHQYGVIEMGMRGRGEIALLTEIANPNIGVITNVGTAHIGRLGSREEIALAKCELLEKMDSSGVAILNYDCPLLIETASKIWSGKTITYGLTGGDLKGEIIANNLIKVNNKIYPLPLKGNHHALNFLAALAITKVLNLDLSLLEKPLIINLPEGRAKLEKLNQNVEILDETYNAGLESMLASLQLLKDIPGQRKIAVLGAMKELGDYSSTFHYQVGEMVKKLEIDCLFILNNDSAVEYLIQGADSVYTETTDNYKDLVKMLLAQVKNGDRLLFKASHSVGLSQVVKEFIKLWNLQNSTEN